MDKATKNIRAVLAWWRDRSKHFWDERVPVSVRNCGVSEALLLRAPAWFRSHSGSGVRGFVASGLLGNGV